jgi:hypothetical protein
MTQIVTVQEIKDYVLSQPDDRPLDNLGSFSTDGCGCVMVQYGRDVLGLTDFHCSFNKWAGFAEIENGTNIYNAFGLKHSHFLGIKTFGQLKKYCQ